jgi:hypothetical protein
MRLSLSFFSPFLVIPAKAEIQQRCVCAEKSLWLAERSQVWIPAFAGMTKEGQE